MPTLSLLQGTAPLALGGTMMPLLSAANGAPRAWVWLEHDGEDGVGLAPLERISERGPSQHGRSDRGFRLQARTITLALALRGLSPADLYDAREALLNALTPTDSALALRWDLENGQVRQIDCFASDGATMDSKDRLGTTQKLAVQFSCPDPTFYDPTPVAITFGASGGAAGMAIPWKTPWKLGASNINQSRPLAYGGSWRTNPIIQISGPVTSPVITNAIDGSKLDFTGTTIADGDTYTIDCRYGLKTVEDAAGVNRVAKLVSGSSLAFALHPHPVAPGGTNQIVVNGTSIGANTEVYLTFNTRYIGF